MSEPRERRSLLALAELVREQGGLMASLLADGMCAHDRAGPAQAVAAGPRARRAPAEYELLVEAIYEGYLLHYGTPRVIASPEADLCLLAGDRLYALGLARLVALEDTVAVAELADTITLSALAHSCDRPDARTGGVGSRRTRRRVGFQCEPPAGQAARLRWCARGDRGDAHKRAGGFGAALNRASILFAVVPDKHAKPTPIYTLDRAIPGAFEGETVTRRRFMTGSAHTAGAIAASAFLLPSLAFAVGPIFKSTPVRWESVGPTDMFNEFNYMPVILTLNPPDRRGRQDDGVRAQVQPGDRHRPLRPRHQVHRDLQPLCTPWLSGPLGRRGGALHLPLPRRRV